MIVLGCAGVLALGSALILLFANYVGDKSLLWKKVMAPKRRKEFDMMVIESSAE